VRGSRWCSIVDVVRTIDEVLDGGMVRSLYQPIVHLDSGKTIGFEALGRGPRGSALESADQLLAAADASQLTPVLDWAWQIAALRGAMDAQLGHAAHLFINIEPLTLTQPPPMELIELLEASQDELDIVIEVTERSLLIDPAGLIRGLGRLRELGFGVAIDDIGARPESLALLPFVAPDVIKLDLRLVRERTDREIAAIVGAVQHDAERRDALILAEGIETEEHLDRALVFGAHLGQGWFFGEPDRLPEPMLTTSGHLIHRARPEPTVETPFALVATSSRRRTTTKRLLLPMSTYIEDQASAGEPAVVISAFQSVEQLTPAVVARYEHLAQQCCLVGAVGAGISTYPARGVRGGTLPDGHPLNMEWTVTVVGPHDAAALIARDLGDRVDEPDRRFEYVITHDRPTVIAAAKSLIAHIHKE
jgi:EAL domain-containing protein (putative c-di-GMP-specific phosphodiesterase class I)